MSCATTLDDHGQPILRLYNRKQRHDRSIDELIGLCKGVCADGVVNKEEAEFILGWLLRQNDVHGDPIVSVLMDRVGDMLSDGVLDDMESLDLLGTLEDFTGQIPAAKVVENMASKLPLDTPPPPVIFEEKLFCFSGRFLFGPRRECEELTVELGGACHNAVVKKLDYLVIGNIGSEDWIHSSWGRKIEKAVRYRSDGEGVAIIHEDHWARNALEINEI